MLNFFKISFYSGVEPKETSVDAEKPEADLEEKDDAWKRLLSPRKNQVDRIHELSCPRNKKKSRHGIE